VVSRVSDRRPCGVTRIVACAYLVGLTLSIPRTDIPIFQFGITDIRTKDNAIKSPECYEIDTFRNE